MRLSEAAEQYVSDPASGLRTTSSVRTYRSVLNLFVRQVGDSDLNDVTPDAIVDWVLGDGVASGTQALRRTCVIGFYRWCEFRDLVTGRNPARKVEGVRINRKKVRQGNWLTDKQVAQIVQTCDTGDLYGERDRIIIMLGVFLGLRRAEIANLKWSDVDLDAGTLKLLGKGEKLATLGIPEQLATVLADWRAKFPEITAATPIVCKVILSATQWANTYLEVCWQERVQPLTVWRAVHRRATLAGMPAVAPHDLRRTYAALLHQRLSLEETSKLLRHTDISTTQRYLADDPTATVENGQAFKLDLGGQ
jgi:integrase